MDQPPVEQPEPQSDGERLNEASDIVMEPDSSLQRDTSIEEGIADIINGDVEESVGVDNNNNSDNNNNNNTNNNNDDDVDDENAERMQSANANVIESETEQREADAQPAQDSEENESGNETVPLEADPGAVEPRPPNAIHDEMDTSEIENTGVENSAGVAELPVVAAPEGEVVTQAEEESRSDPGRDYHSTSETKMADQTDDDATVKTRGSTVTAASPSMQGRTDKRKHMTTPADDSGLTPPLLPAIPRGQVKVDQIATSISHARKKEDVPPTIQTIRSRVPPKLVRLATVTVSPAKSRQAPKGPSLYYEEPRRPQKVITWDKAHNSRPPLRIDMEGPGPCSYSPTNKPLGESNAPCYTFGTKCFPEKTGGARTSWGKSWFQSNHLWHNKADYSREGLWPSPNHYHKAPLLGPRQRTMPEAPSYTFGHRQEFSIIKQGSEKEPSPNDYERQNADKLVLRRGPSFTHQVRREGTLLWGFAESNPGPAAYTPKSIPKQVKPAFTIQGIRREKSHILGPYSTI